MTSRAEIGGAAILRRVAGVFALSVAVAAGSNAVAAVTAAPAKAVAFAQAVDKSIQSRTLEAKPVAPVALSHLVAAAADTQNFKLLGFNSTDEAKTATLGTPLVVYYVPLDKLRTYTAMADPVSLLAGGDRLLYPVLLGRTVRSSVTLAKVNGAWTHVISGRPLFAATIFTARSDDAAKSRVLETRYVEVSVPALSMEFIGRAGGTGLVLIPLRDYPALALMGGQTYSAADVFQRLSAVARRNNTGASN
jgi:hypothetical protein